MLASLCILFLNSAGVLNADDLETEYGNDLDFLIAKLKIAAAGSCVSVVIATHFNYTICTQLQL